ncbi:MAG: hypothetical protein SFU57_00065 [Gemmatimonadales bacterium]|nr:hypothetical protein [Gemmatimonadales bacterium]
MISDEYVDLTPAQRAAIAKVRLPTAPRGPADRSLLEWALRADARAALTAFGRNPVEWPGPATLAVQLATARVVRGPLPLVASEALLQATIRWYAQGVLDKLAEDDLGRTEARETVSTLELILRETADLWPRLRLSDDGEVLVDPTDPEDER